MRLLLDEGLSFRTAEMLRTASIDARHVREIGMEGASDDAILDTGAKDERVIVTLDADFHQILAEREAASPSVLRIHAERLNAAQAMDMIVMLLDPLEGIIAEHGNVVASFRNGRLRARSLPLLRGALNEYD